MTSETLVLGATGKTGRRVADRLAASGVAVRAGSRTGQPPFDWTAPATWGPALRGVRSAYVSYYPDLAVPGATEAVGSFVDAAMVSGVRRLVLLSGRGEDEAEAAEKVLRDSGAEWTILRANWFAQNFSESYLLEPVLAGEVVLPAGQVPEPFVDAEDIADVAAAALTDDRHVGQLYTLSGPRALTFAEAVAEIAAATGRQISYIPIGADDYARAALAGGVPSDVVDFLTYLFTTVLDGRNTAVADGVQRALGRTPRDFTDYARRTAATGVWGS